MNSPMRYYYAINNIEGKYIKGLLLLRVTARSAAHAGLIAITITKDL